MRVRTHMYAQKKRVDVGNIPVINKKTSNMSTHLACQHQPQSLKGHTRTVEAIPVCAHTHLHQQASLRM